MTRSIKPPSYRKHSQSGQAVVTIPYRGGRKDVLLGSYGSPESQREYVRVIAEWSGTVAGMVQSDGRHLTINEMILAFWNHAEEYYRKPDGTLTTEIDTYRAVIRDLRSLYGLTRATDFGPLALKALREKWITAGIVRTQVNARVYRVRRIFKWAVGEQLLPAVVWESLKAVEGLKKGRSRAKESLPVKPADDNQIARVLEKASPMIASMIRTQLLTGARPGEICLMSWEMIDRSKPVWEYHLTDHKTAHHDRNRVIFIGPRAQSAILKVSEPAEKGVVFSPVKEIEFKRAAAAVARKTPMYPSHMRRNKLKRKVKPRWTPGLCYSQDAYRRAITRICETIWPLPTELARDERETVHAWETRLGPQGMEKVSRWKKAHYWSPNRLRHAAATAIRKEYGVEAARTVLGHSELDVTEIYAERDLAMAAKIAAEMG